MFSSPHIPHDVNTTASHLFNLFHFILIITRSNYCVLSECDSETNDKLIEMWFKGSQKYLCSSFD